ncbi:RNA polymerase sigma24 factor [Streptomyces umbrinus]|uniref:SigE family RNA polymerase sigma factor n=1 Tax=Streptomyces umbrinus TaxID=67370 RepID=UPI0019A62E09|nr:RNA polymerase sigma24 factor [Streptomyces umbrinus]
MFISKAPERAGSSFDDSHGFDAFYTSTAKRMVATVYAMTGDLAEAEDAVHEAYVRCLAALARLVRDGDPLPWVRTVAMRLAISTWRRTRGRLRAHFRHGPQADVPELSADRVALVVALRELSPDQRQAVILHHLLDLPVEQVAREIGASSGAVRTRLSRARRILGERLAEADSAFTSKGVAGHG